MWRLPGLGEWQTKAAHWVLVILWVAAVSVISSIPGQDVPKVGVPHLDKVVHFVMFLPGGLLLSLALIRGGFRPGRRLFWIAVAAVAAFGVIDEVSQLWTPGRYGGSIGDMLANALGGFAGCALAFKIHEKFRHRKSAGARRSTAPRHPEA